MQTKILKVIRQTKIQLLVLCLITVICYSNILLNGISFDDRDFLIDWPAIRSSQTGLSAWLNLPDLLAGDLPAAHKGVYRPIRSVIYLISLQLWGFNPLIFHLQSLVTHLLITYVIYLTTKLLTKDKVIPFATAALFASHPIHTEAVTYTAASFDTIGILFFFSSFYFYIKSRIGKHDKSSSRILSLLLAFLAFFTYEMTLVLPLLIISYEIYFQNLNPRDFLKKFKLFLPYLIILAGYIATRVLLLNIGNRADYLGGTYLAASNQAKLAIFEILFQYLYLLSFPLHLTINYPVPEYGFSLFYKLVSTIDPSGNLLNSTATYIFLFPIAIVLLFLAFIYRFKKYKIPAFSATWFLLSLIPVLNIIPQGSVMAERFLYIPSFAFCLLLAFIIPKLIYKLPIKLSYKLPLFALIILTIISLYAARTIIRNQDWSSQESIFLSAARDDDWPLMPYSSLSKIKFNNQQYEESLKYTKLALELDPTLFELHFRNALSYEKLGNLKEAENSYRQSLKIEKNYYYSYIQLGNLYLSQNRISEAKTEYENALKIEPNSFESLYNLAGIFVRQNNLTTALDYYNRALKINPAHASTYNNIGYIYELQNIEDKALHNYSQAVLNDSKNQQFITNYNRLKNLTK